MNDKKSPIKSSRGHRHSIASKPLKKVSDAELLDKYIDRLNDVIEQSKILEKKLKEKEELIEKIKTNPKKYLKNISCDKCNIHLMEIEDHLQNLYNKNKILKQRKNIILPKPEFSSLCINKTTAINFFINKQSKNKSHTSELTQPNKFSTNDFVINHLNFEFEALGIL